MAGARDSGNRYTRLAAAVLVAVASLVLAASASAASGTQPRFACSTGARSPQPPAAPYTTETVPNNAFVPHEQAPDQWLAKLFTEGLGCAPAQSSYTAADAYVLAHGCTPQTLATLGQSLLTSREFMRRPYGNGARLLVLWRIAYEAEPDQATYDSLLHALDSRQARWADVVHSFFADPQFVAAVPRLCSGEPYGMDAHTPVIDIPTSHTGALGDATGADLQQILDRAQPGTTVWLERGAVIRVGSGIKIPPGVTLKTVGAPGPRDYASMGRLVRTAVNHQPVVALGAGAVLANVWVDGQRSNQDIGQDHDSIDVEVLGGDGTTVRDDRITNTSGWSNLVVDNGATGTPQCSNVAIEDNLIDGYATKFHWHETTGVVDGRVDTGTVAGQLNNLESGQQSVSSTFGFADGISNQCWDSHIAGNQLVDITDVSVVLFGSERPDQAQDVPHQHSLVENNTILNAGNSGWAAMTIDPLYQIGTAKYDNFAGTTIRNNLIWTSPNGFLLLIAGIGTKPWFGGNTAYGYGPVLFQNNTSGRVRVNTQMAIAVTRMSGAVVTGNTLLADLALADLCPNGTYIGVDESDGSRVQQPYEDVSFPSFPIPSEDQGCLNMHF
jgi:hypothetical protein